MRTMEPMVLQKVSSQQQMIKNQRAYIDFVSGKEVTIPQLKKFMNVMKDDYVLKTTED